MFYKRNGSAHVACAAGGASGAAAAESVTPPESPYRSGSDDGSEPEVEGSAPRPAASAAPPAGAADAPRCAHGAPSAQPGAACEAAQGTWLALTAGARAPAGGAQERPKGPRAAGGAAAAAAQAVPSHRAMTAARQAGQARA